jgi:hypothetical protein
MNAAIRGVELPDGSYVRDSMSITKQHQADKLPKIDDLIFAEELGFNMNVVRVNVDLVEEYIRRDPWRWWLRRRIGHWEG